jgi:hypothetical protein
MTSGRSIAAAASAALYLGVVMTLGDVTWARLNITHRVVYGIAHGAVMCFCMGIVLGVRAGRPVAGALAGPAIGVLAALSFYLLAPVLQWRAMVPAWMFFWVLFAFLQHRLRPIESAGVTAVRGLAAAVFSGLACYAVSGIWAGLPAAPGYARSVLSWSFAFLPGFLALFLASGTEAAREGAPGAPAM